MNRTTLTERDIDGRADDRNRIEFEAIDPKRVMTEVLQERIHAALNRAYELEEEDGGPSGC